MLSLDAVIARAQRSGEEVIAHGTASYVPVVVTHSRLMRAGHDDVVAVPFDSVVDCESWLDTHRWAIRLRHEPIDPHLPPSGITQWWRWHDRRKRREEIERRSRETVLTFSSERTAAALALQERLAARGLVCRTVPSPVHRHLGSIAALQRVDDD